MRSFHARAHGSGVIEAKQAVRIVDQHVEVLEEIFAENALNVQVGGAQILDVIHEHSLVGDGVGTGLEKVELREGCSLARSGACDHGRALGVQMKCGGESPRWSPDGRYLATETQDHQLKIFDFKTQQWAELALHEELLGSREWSRDSQFIYFRGMSGDRGVFRIRVNGSAEEKIADLKDWRDAGWWGSSMGLDPTDAPLLLRNIAGDDIYALTLEQK
jgi:hypothetical protein